jgi:hypothetical protein
MAPIDSLGLRTRFVRYILITTLAFFIFSSYFRLTAFAQPWIESIAIEERENFFELQKAFENYFRHTSSKKGDGYKQFKRWQWYWQSRLNADRSFPPANMEEWKITKKNLSVEPIKLAATCLGGSPSGRKPPAIVIWAY